MKNLYLVRHAKSSWKLPVDDLKRPLKKRGILDAILISDHIKKLVSKPDFLLTSDANFLSRMPSFSITYLVFMPDAFSINSEDE